MGVIRQLKNFFTGKIIYPKTLTKAVYDENGERLDKILRDTMLAVDNEEYDGVEPRDADTLGGKYTAKDIGSIEDKLTGLNSSLTASDGLKFRFGKDGDGNYGYYGADDSLIPFSSLFFRNMTPYVFNDIYQNSGAQTFHDFDQNYKYIMFVGHTSSVGVVSVFKHDGAEWNEITNPKTHLNVVFSFDTSMNRLWITNNFSENLSFYLVGFK